MDELYLETKDGTVPIEQKVVKELKLKKGTRSPFTRNRIVGENGDFTPEALDEKETDNLGLNQKPEDGTVELENGVLFSTSEIIDLAHGEDSSTEH